MKKETEFMIMFTRPADCRWIFLNFDVPFKYANSSINNKKILNNRDINGTLSVSL